MNHPGELASSPAVNKASRAAFIIGKRAGGAGGETERNLLLKESTLSGFIIYTPSL